ncbi:unnamed protein product [Zymoseptoria tritici ST99CH_1E4]|uniref:Uncharacterized protein n=1 Tax=Zymoseptoria tritici ST99CH_1E4 TaxID=1276532 RepID=A0A2H1GL55_ZYMTR|nr:unnamed protein product [Zymoseptoria tritici ST99CH_1E4]
MGNKANIKRRTSVFNQRKKAKRKSVVAGAKSPQRPSPLFPPRVDNILQLPKSIVVDIVDALTIDFATNTKPHAILRVCRDLRTIGFDCIAAHSLFTCTLDLALIRPRQYALHERFSGLPEPMKQGVRFQNIEFIHADLASGYSLSRYAMIYSCTGALGNRQINWPDPSGLGSGLSVEETTALAMLTAERKKAWSGSYISNDSAPVPVRQHNPDALTISYTFRDYGPLERDPMSKLYQQLLVNVAQGLQDFGMREAGTPFGDGTQYMETRIFQYLSDGHHLPEDYQTAFWWFKETFLDGLLGMPRERSFTEHQKREERIGVKRDRRVKLGGPLREPEQ